MVLTKAEENLIPYVNEVLQSIEKLHSFKLDLSEYRGDLRVGVAESQLCYRFSPILKEVHQKAPNAHLFLRSMNCYDIRDELLDGSLDIGIFYEDAGVTYLPLFTAENELKTGALKEIKTEIANPRIIAVCAHHKNKWVSPLMQFFIDLCTNHF